MKITTTSYLGDQLEIHTGHSMQGYTTQPIPIFCKVSHIHYCAEALKSKDIRNFIRHFLWLTANFQNFIESDKSLRSMIAGLTGWDPKAITNAITRMINDGEIARINERSFILNHELGNKFPSFGAFHQYEGLSPTYSEGQVKLIGDLRKLLKSLMPNRDVLDTEANFKEYEAEMLAEIHRITQKVDEQSEQLKSQYELLQKLLLKLEQYEPAEVQQIKKTQLELVRL